MTFKAWIGMSALGLAALIAATSAAAACDWHDHNKTSMLSAPVAKAAPARTAVAAYPVDLWLLPYLA